MSEVRVDGVAAVRTGSTDVDATVVDVVRQSARRVPAFADRLAAAGIDAAEVRGVADLDRLPVLSKDEMVELQQAQPPFGGLLAADATARRVFQSPGPLYEPELGGGDHWRFAEALRAAGFEPADVVLNCFGYHLSPAGAIFEEAAAALGATVVPGGIGNLDLQVRCVADLRVSAYTGLPSYLKALVDRYAESGLDRAAWRVDRAVVAAEPLTEALRTELAPWVPTVLTAYGTAETGLLAYETTPGSGWRVAAGVLVQICALDSGLPITDGHGQVVVTVLRSDYPLVRFGTGDLSEWMVGPAGELRLAGVLGRVGQAVKVRGMFLHPRQAAAVLDGASGLGAYRFVIDRDDHADRLRCEIVVSPGADCAKVVTEVRARIRAGLRFDAEVSAVSAIPDDAEILLDRR